MKWLLMWATASSAYITARVIGATLWQALAIEVTLMLLMIWSEDTFGGTP